MGRYYYGDIEGKFWFAVQSSNAADRFGVVGTRPQTIQYYFTKEDLPAVQQELKKIETTLGEYKERIKQYFEERQGYRNDEMAQALNISEKDLKTYLREYADYELGEKIEKHLLEHETCQFEGEL